MENFRGFEFLRLAGILLTSHTLYIKKNAIIFGFFQVNKASLLRTSSTIILLMFENVVNNILFVLLVVTPHFQRKRGKVVVVVSIYIYIAICL